MKLRELLGSEIMCRYDVYLQDPKVLTVSNKLFDSFWDVDDEEQKQLHFEMFEKYCDYDVVYFFAKARRDSDEDIPEYIDAYTKVIIAKPEDESKLPF